MALENFIPKLWSAQLHVELKKALVFGNLVTKEYQGNIANLGDTVYINELGPVSVNSYAKGDTLTYETLTSAQKALVIDQGSSFSFKIDDIDMAQTNPKLMAPAMADAGYRIASTIDAYIAGLYAQAGVTGSATYIGSASASVSVSSGNVLETVTYAQRYLLEKNVKSGDCWMIVPPWMHQKLLLALEGTISATGVPKMSDSGLIMNGYVGKYSGFNIMVSNNVSVSSTQYRVMCGTSRAIAYAGQIAEIETLRLQTTFANAARGLYLYGAKVTAPNELCTMYLAEAAG